MTKIEKEYAEQGGKKGSGIAELDYLKSFTVKMSLREIKLLASVHALSEEVRILKQHAGLSEDDNVFDHFRKK